MSETETHKIRVVEWIEIGAPRSEVFNLITDLQRRMQLSPLWGLFKVEHMSTDYPTPGSHYRTRFVKGDGSQHETVVTDLIPERKLAYRLDTSQETEVSWFVQETRQGTRLTYQEEFLAPPEEEAAFIETVRGTVKGWLGNIKRYAELRGGRKQRLAKWLIDRYYLKLPTEQRRVIQTILFMQVLGTISFLMAAIALGLSSLI